MMQGGRLRYQLQSSTITDNFTFRIVMMKDVPLRYKPQSSTGHRLTPRVGDRHDAAASACGTNPNAVRQRGDTPWGGGLDTVYLPAVQAHDAVRVRCGTALEVSTMQRVRVRYNS